MALRQRRNACRSRASTTWLGVVGVAIVNARSGPNCASIGSAHEVLVGVRHNSTLCLAAHLRMVGVLFADRLSRIT